MQSKHGTAEFTASDGQVIPVRIAWRRNAKRLCLRLNLRNQIEISAASAHSREDCLAFLQANRKWVEVRIAEVPKQFELFVWLREHPHVSLNGRRLPVEMRLSSQPKLSMFGEGDGLSVELRAGSENADLNKLMRALATQSLKKRLDVWRSRLGLSVQRVSVRDQSSRWGSCSSRGGISLNWRLILLEPELQDYVLLHELAHLTEHNHSKHFWELVETYDPLYRDHEYSLKQIGPQIMRVGRD